MSYLLSLDPGKNSGIALGYYDDETPYDLVWRRQVHDGLEGFVEWREATDLIYTEFVVERFVLDPTNEFTADLTPARIEGYLRGAIEREHYAAINWQLRSDKALLTGYPASAVTPAQKQRVRFDFLKRFDLFRPGADNDDSNDAITHALVFLKKRRHLPTLRKYWPPRQV